jgi:hypothetical protein
MSALFGSPKMPAQPGPDPELVRQQKEQEQRLEAQERQQMAELSARKRAQRRAGSRQLIFGSREDPYLGVPEDSFGPAFNREQQGRIV